MDGKQACCLMVSLQNQLYPISIIAHSLLRFTQVQRLENAYRNAQMMMMCPLLEAFADCPLSSIR